MGNASTRMKKRGHGRVVVFGRRAVMEALTHPKEDVRVEVLRASRDLPAPFRKELAATARSLDVTLELVSAAEVRALSGEPRHDQGVVAQVHLERLSDVASFIEAGKGKAARRPRRLITLDGVTNSQNIGMIVRSAVATGMDGMLWPLVGSPWINGLTIKASAGFIYRAPLIRCDTLAEGLFALKAAGYAVFGLTGKGDTSLFELEVPHRAIFVVGSETAGISDEVAALLDASLRIPMAPGVDSLNVAVAASLACFKAAGTISGA